MDEAPGLRKKTTGWMEVDREHQKKALGWLEEALVSPYRGSTYLDRQAPRPGGVGPCLDKGHPSWTEEASGWKALEILYRST